MRTLDVPETVGAAGGDWQAINRQYLDLQVARLRLRLERRITWLRTRWKHDPLQTYASEVISDARADSHLDHQDADP